VAAVDSPTVLPPAAASQTDVAQRIVVADQTLAAAPGERVVNTLADACREAANSGVTTVELRFRGRREELPFEIAAPTLTIRNAPGWQPVLVFRPRSTDRRSMVQVRGGRLAWQGVHVELDLELTAGNQPDWTMFHVGPAAGIEVRDAVLTVRNLDAAGQPRHARVSFVAVQDQTAETAPAGNGSDRSGRLPVQVGFERGVVRGQATVVRSLEGSPFRLIAENTFFVTRERLVDADGAANRPSLKEGRIDLELNHVTAVLGQGLCRLMVDMARPYQLDLHSDCRDSILVASQPDVPLYERWGLVSLEDVGNRLDLRGRDNFFLGSTRVLRLRSSGPAAPAVDYDFEERDRMPFLEEKSPSFVLLWRGLPAADLSEDLRTPEDYLLDGSLANPAVRAADRGVVGADLMVLPIP
jgi:hypothetical protein